MTNKNTVLPLKWHGGKQYLAEWIISHLPPADSYIHYVEPYFGGGSVLFNKPIEHVLDHSEVANDLNLHLSNFWTVLAHHNLFKEFQRKIEAAPISQNMWEQCSRAMTSSDQVQQALAFFIKYRQSRQGLGKDFATLSKNRTRRRMNEQASAWWSAVEGLPEIHNRLKRVVIMNTNALQLIEKEDGPNTFLYCDPPYLHSTRVTTNDYEHECNAQHHQNLLQILGKIQGKFLLSGYPSQLYEEATAKYGWKCYIKPTVAHSSSKKEKPVRLECLWRNY